MKTKATQEIYTALASIYDEIMSDIDYAFWSDFIDAIIQEHHPNAESVLELGCGTGSFALLLDELGCYRITATDASASMIDRAKEKAGGIENNVKFEILDFRNITIKSRFDVVLMLFDSINYLLNRNDIISMLREVRKVLNPNGCFIFDFTTPGNSIRAEHLLNEERVTDDGFWYSRKSRYDAKQKLHFNDFEIRRVGSDAPPVRESHCQRTYTLSEIQEMIKEATYGIEASYENFDLIPADQNSDRITMVIR